MISFDRANVYPSQATILGKLYFENIYDMYLDGFAFNGWLFGL